MDGHAPTAAAAPADTRAPDVLATALARTPRKLGPRKTVTLNARRASGVEIHRLRSEGNAEEIERHERPRTRGDCLPGGCNGARPCPWVSCTRHLAIDVDERTGSMKLNFPELEVWEMRETCALDIADRGAATLEEVGAVMHLTRERTRQIETRALALVAAAPEALEWLDGPPAKVRRVAPSLVRGGKSYRKRGEFRSLAHLRATLMLERGASLDEVVTSTGLTRHQAQQLVWRIASRARAAVSP